MSPSVLGTACPGNVTTSQISQVDFYYSSTSSFVEFWHSAPAKSSSNLYIVGQLGCK